jgi:hypothetical protein
MRMKFFKFSASATPLSSSCALRATMQQRR